MVENLQKTSITSKKREEKKENEWRKPENGWKKWRTQILAPLEGGSRLGVRIGPPSLRESRDGGEGNHAKFCKLSLN